MIMSNRRRRVLQLVLYSSIFDRTCLSHFVVSCLSVAGTFITEWDEGKRICAKLLSSRSRYEEIATKMCSLAVYYGFDGWLINIENEVDVSQPRPQWAVITAMPLVRATPPMGCHHSHAHRHSHAPNGLSLQPRPQWTVITATPQMGCHHSHSHRHSHAPI